MSESDERRQNLLQEVNRSLRTDGLTRNEFEEIKNRLVSPSWTVEDFVYARIDFLEVKLEDDRFVTDLSRITLYMELDPETEKLLRRKIAETGKSASALILGFIKDALQAN